MKQKITIIILSVLVVLAGASGWIYHAIVNKNDTAISQADILGLQVSFLKQYGTDSSITQMITPKIYEVAWEDKSGSKNVSMNVGGVWVLIANNPAPIPTDNGK